MWSTQYLLNLQESKTKRHNFTKTKPKVGQLVLLHQEKTARHKWPLAQIVKLLPSADGMIRSVLIKCQKQLLKRSVKHLIPLEIDETEQDEKIREDTDNTQTEQNDTRNPENYELTKESEENLNENKIQTKRTGDLENETRKNLPRKAKKPINYAKMNRGFSVAGGSVAE
uniref:DUF5641 domain-containing protein n=1 Tax=Caenorhabditis japonica TaxID=281687 RepID=A0A8R1E3M2_CAEJA